MNSRESSNDFNDIERKTAEELKFGRCVAVARRDEWNTLLTAISGAGWSYRTCKHGIYVYPAEKSSRPITLAGTPGDHRSFVNTRAALRRAGLAGV